MAHHDRTGELVDEDDIDQQPQPAHDALCADGWLPETADGRARPCLDCRPHLRGRRERLRRFVTGQTR